MSHIQTGIQTFKKVQKSATNIIQAVLRLKELKDDNMLKGAEAPQLIRKIGKWEKVVADPLLTLIAPYRYRMENYMRRDDEGTENFDAIQDSLHYYGNLTEIVGMFLGRLENLKKNLKKESRIDCILSAKALHAIDRYYQAGMLHYETGMVREATKKVEKALTEFSCLADAGLQKEYWQVALMAHSLLAELYIKQHRLHEAKEILDVLDVIVNKEDIQIHGTGSDGGNIRSLLIACHEGLRVWEKRQEVALERLERSATNYGSTLESGSFYFRVGDFERAEGCYLKAIEECSLALADNHSEYDVKTLHLIRLVGAYYGFAQTCLELNKQSDAIAALDSGSPNIILLHECDPDILEEFGNLYCDLYLRVGRPAQAMYTCSQLLGIVPHSVTMNRRMRTMMSESDQQALAGHA
jgi:tetratricopeptide (TPR) repeat protein